MTLTVLFSTVYRPMRLRGRSPKTSRLYMCLFAAMQRHFLRELEVDELSDLVVAGYLESRSMAGLSPFTVEKERCQILALWRFAADRNLINTRPCCPPAPLPLPAPLAWSMEDMKRVVYAASECPGLVGRVSAGVWWKGLVCFAFETGERIGAIMLAKKHSVSGRSVTIGALDRKGGQSAHVHFISEPTLIIVQKIMSESVGDKIFEWDRDPTSLWGIFKKIIKSARVPVGDRSSFHQIRRTAASWLAASGGNPVEFLGHSSPKICKKYYLDPRICSPNDRHACDIMPSLSTVADDRKPDAAA